MVSLERVKIEKSRNKNKGMYLSPQDLADIIGNKVTRSNILSIGGVGIIKFINNPKGTARYCTYSNIPDVFRACVIRGVIKIGGFTERNASRWSDVSWYMRKPAREELWKGEEWQGVLGRIDGISVGGEGLLSIEKLIEKGKIDDDYPGLEYYLKNREE